jgi:hypothetical protein
MRLGGSGCFEKEFSMDELKPLVASRTFWGAVLSLASSGLAAGHYTLTPADAASAVDIVVSIISGVGGLVAIYGRVVASKQIAWPK